MLCPISSLSLLLLPTSSKANTLHRLKLSVSQNLVITICPIYCVQQPPEYVPTPAAPAHPPKQLLISDFSAKRLNTGKYQVSHMVCPKTSRVCHFPLSPLLPHSVHFLSLCLALSFFLPISIYKRIQIHIIYILCYRHSLHILYHQVALL